MTNTTKLNKIWTATIFIVAVALLLTTFAVVFAPVSNTARADVAKVPYDENLDWEQIYEDYVGDTDKDWYLGEDYLNYYNAFESVQDMLADKSFNKRALKEDPIIIAVVDDGIGNAYIENADGTKTAKGAATFFKEQDNPELKYEIHPIFKDVLLTDENGNYVYKTVVDSYDLNETIYEFPHNGDIAHDMVSFTQRSHGTATTGVIAFFIHKFGLEDYIKIVPIKADNYLRPTGVSYAGNEWDKKSVDFALEVGADILSVSISGMLAASPEEVRQSMLIVQAAGNKAEYVTNREPAKFDDVLCVTNYDRDADGNIVLYEHYNSEGTLTGGSNYGDICDIAAPGEYLVVPVRNATYDFVGGTSMSAPVVSFASALAMFRYRGYNNYGTGWEMTSKAYKEMVSYTFDKTVTKVAPEGTFTDPALDFEKIVTYDYFSDPTYVENAELTYSQMFTLTTNAESEMQVGDEIGVKAYVTDQSFADCTVQWECYVNGILIEDGNGWDFEMTVPKMAGDYVIYADLYNGNTLLQQKTVTFRVVEWGRDWQEIYDDFTDDIRDDWYYDEQYLDLYNAIVEVQNMLNDSIFDRDALKKDPIVIASIETGISSGYIKSSGSRAGLTAMFINPVEVEYVLHPIFEDVLLKDENGDYVYYLSTPTFEYQPRKTAQDPNPSLVTYYWNNTGDIAKDMVCVDDHGIGVTGVMAFLIHQFGLEDYIKILPIKADCAYVRDNQNALRTNYNMNALNDAIRYAKEAGADIVNASFGGSADNNLYGAYGDSMLVVGAAGNNNEMVQFYPAGFENVLGVMDYSRDKDGNVVLYVDPDNPTTGATYGEWYDLAAPGEDLVTPCYGNHISYTTSYKQMHGASAAAPVASFASALALFRYRGYNSYGTGIEITPKVVREMIPYCTDKVATKDVGNGVVYEYPALDFKSILTYGFFEDPTFMANAGLHASGYFGALSNAKDVEEVGNTILLRAMTIAEDGKYDSISNPTWYYRLDGVEYTIGTGNEINFVIPEEGDYDIYYVLTVWKGTAYDLKRSAETIRFSVPAEQQKAPEEVIVSGNLQANYKVDSGKSVTLTATIGADEYTEDTPYWWGVLDGKYTFEIGSGWTVNYKIPTTAGSYEIFCALVDENGVKYAQSTAKLAFVVSYYEPQSITIYSNAKSEYKVDTTDKIMLSAVVSPANSYTDGEFAWFYLSEGGKYHFITTGLTAELQVPQEVGTYKINCGYRNSDGAYYLLSKNPIDFTVTNYVPEYTQIIVGLDGDYPAGYDVLYELKARVYPTNAVTEDTLVWWYEFGGEVFELGEGQSLPFGIPEVAGEYTIYCALENADGERYAVCTNPNTFTIYYNKPTSVTISGEVEDEYKVDTDAVVRLTGKITDKHAETDDPLVWWYRIGDSEFEIGSGREISFEIPNVAGEYKVYCAFVDADGSRYGSSTNSIEFTVTNYVPESISVSADVEDEYKVDTDAVVTLSATINPTLAVTEDTLTWWYELGGVATTIGTGATVDFAIPNVVGEYTIHCALVNADGEKTLVSTDTISFVVTNYVPESIVVTSNVAKEYKVDTTAVVALTATINPTLAVTEDTLTWWCELGGVATTIGTGATVDFEIPNAVGEYTIHCALVNADGEKTLVSADTISFVVSNYAPVSISVSANVEDEYKVDTTAVVTLSATLGANEYTADTPYWWGVVDGKYTFEIGSGWKVDYQIPTTAGSYEIFCALVDGNGVKYAQSTDEISFVVSNYAVESVSILANAKSEYKVDNNETIVLSASFNPSNALVDGRLYWHYSDGMAEFDIGFGSMVQFEIPNIVGEYTIHCEYISNDGNSINSTNTISFAVTNYVPESIVITSNVAKEYKVDTDAVVALSATINPTLAVTEDTLTWWYELGGNETTIGTGATVDFAIPNVVGEYTIHCALVDNQGNKTLVSTDTISFAVTNYVPESIAVSVVDHDAVSVTFAATINPTNAYTEDTLVWMCKLGTVANEIGTGATLDFVIPTEPGTYTIYCVLKDGEGNVTLSNSNEFTVEVLDYSPKSTTIAGTFEDEYKVDTTEVVTLTATTNPSNFKTEDTIVWWYEVSGNETIIGTGATIEFAIPDTAGNYVVKCAYVDKDGVRYAQSTNTLAFAVVYYAPEDVEVEVVETFDKAVNYAIAENLIDPSVVEDIKWYLNGALVATGASYTCSMVLPGEYVITVVVDGQERQVATHTVGGAPTPPIIEVKPTPPTQEDTPTVEENDDNGAKTALIATSSVLGSSTLGFGVWALALLLKKKRKIA